MINAPDSVGLQYLFVISIYSTENRLGYQELVFLHPQSIIQEKQKDLHGRFI